MCSHKRENILELCLMCVQKLMYFAMYEGIQTNKHCANNEHINVYSENLHKGKIYCLRQGLLEFAEKRGEPSKLCVHT